MGHFLKTALRSPRLGIISDERKLTDSSTTSQISTAPIWHNGVDDTKIDKVSYPLWQSQHFANNQGREQVTTLLEKRDPLHRFGLDRLPSRSSSTLFPDRVHLETVCHC